MPNAIAAAVDLSGAMARFALAEADGTVICRTRKPMRQREAAALADFIYESLEHSGRALADIGEWTVGSGPGSFTGMRLAAALVGGLTCGTAAKVRCVPTAVAIADTLGAIPVGTQVIVLFDGRNREIIAFELIQTAGGATPSGESHVLNAAAAEEYFRARPQACIITQLADLEAVKLIAPDITPVAVDDFDPACLIQAKYKEYDGDYTALEYIRPAVYPQTER